MGIIKTIVPLRDQLPEHQIGLLPEHLHGHQREHPLDLPQERPLQHGLLLERRLGLPQEHLQLLAHLQERLQVVGLQQVHLQLRVLLLGHLQLHDLHHHLLRWVHRAICRVVVVMEEHPEAEAAIAVVEVVCQEVAAEAAVEDDAKQIIGFIAVVCQKHSCLSHKHIYRFFFQTGSYNSRY